MLSIRGTDFIACWAYEERVSAHAQPAVTCEHFYMYNPCWANTNECYRTLSIRGTNFIACWAYWEPISLHAEHVRKCLKVEYLSRIECDFQKSSVTGPWDHKVSVSVKKVKKNVMLVYLENSLLYKTSYSFMVLNCLIIPFCATIFKNWWY